MEHERLLDVVEPGITSGDIFLRQYQLDQKDIAREDRQVMDALKNGHKKKEPNGERVIFHRYIR